MCRCGVTDEFDHTDDLDPRLTVVSLLSLLTVVSLVIILLLKVINHVESATTDSGRSGGPSMVKSD